MHDIICPVCGERTLARSVGFDLSDRILPLLPPLPAEVPGLRFLFAADEELLFPDGLPEGGTYVPFCPDADLLRRYINRRTGRESDLMFGELFDAQRDGGSAAGYPPLLCTWLEAVALSCFTRAGRPLRAGRLSEAERRAVADFLCALYRDSAPESGRLTLPLSPVIAPDGVPVEVRLSVGDGTGNQEIARCCPRCGFPFPHGCGHCRERVILAAGDSDADTAHLFSLLCAGAQADPGANILYRADGISLVRAGKRLYALCAPDGAGDTVGYLMDNSRLLPEVDHLFYLFGKDRTGVDGLPEHLCALTEAIRSDRRGKTSPDSLTFLTGARSLPPVDPAAVAGAREPEAWEAVARANREAVFSALPYLCSRLERTYAGADRMFLSPGADAQAGSLLWLRLRYADRNP